MNVTSNKTQILISERGKIEARTEVLNQDLDDFKAMGDGGNEADIVLERLKLVRDEYEHNEVKILKSEVSDLEDAIHHNEVRLRIYTKKGL